MTLTGYSIVAGALALAFIWVAHRAKNAADKLREQNRASD
jgi:hypothetical protein